MLWLYFYQLHWQDQNLQMRIPPRYFGWARAKSAVAGSVKAAAAAVEAAGLVKAAVEGAAVEAVWVEVGSAG
jgi:hypothetical protein